MEIAYEGCAKGHIIFVILNLILSYMYVNDVNVHELNSLNCFYIPYSIFIAKPLAYTTLLYAWLKFEIYTLQHHWDA